MGDERSFGTRVLKTFETSKSAGHLGGAQRCPGLIDLMNFGIRGALATTGWESNLLVGVPPSQQSSTSRAIEPAAGRFKWSDDGMTTELQSGVPHSKRGFWKAQEMCSVDNEG